MANNTKKHAGEVGIVTDRELVQKLYPSARAAKYNRYYEIWVEHRFMHRIGVGATLNDAWENALLRIKL